MPVDDRLEQAHTQAMAYDEMLAERVRDLLAGEPGVTEQKMFGGLAFLLERRLAVAVSHHGGLMLRVEPALTDGLLLRPHTAPVVMREREMSGWLMVLPDGLISDDDLDGWVQRGVSYARSLPPKT